MAEARSGRRHCRHRNIHIGVPYALHLVQQGKETVIVIIVKDNIVVVIPANAEGAEVEAAFQPDAPQVGVQVVQGGAGGDGQMEPVFGAVGVLNYQVDAGAGAAGINANGAVSVGAAGPGVARQAAAQVGGHTGFAVRAAAQFAFAAGCGPGHFRSPPRVLSALYPASGSPSPRLGAAPF